MTPLRIGRYTLRNNLVLAPMAGVTDRPFRVLCRRLGAGLAVSEMVTSNPELYASAETRRRLDHRGEPQPRSVQIVGAEPEMMAQAARHNVAHGAQIIDINMGCPAKRVCKKAAGSALLRDEGLVAAILEAVVEAVEVPVTLKIRTGWDPEHRNGVRIAELAQRLGVRALAVHGRTRACGYRGTAEYATIRNIKRGVSIPVIANGDIDSAEKALRVLEYTGADAIMLGRAAQGRPWIFREIEARLTGASQGPRITRSELGEIILDHVRALHRFHGEHRGVRVARKHIGWYLASVPGSEALRPRINRTDDAAVQLDLLTELLSRPYDESLAA
jgi:tRNA-dihydrouridine synthase B